MNEALQEAIKAKIREFEQVLLETRPVPTLEDKVNLLFALVAGLAVRVEFEDKEAEAREIIEESMRKWLYPKGGAP